MSKKGSDTPSSIRIRENQRRSRNQRKELIQDLQRRVHDYELKGVAATQEMQRAARKVAEENSRLRSLLASRGVTPDEVEAYLRSFDTGSAPTRASHALPVYTQPQGNSTVQSTARNNQSSCMQPTHHSPVPTTMAPTQPPAQPRAQSQRTSQCLTGIVGNKDSHADQHGSTNLSSALHGPTMPTTHQDSSCCRPADKDASDHGAPTFALLQEDAECPNTASCFCPPVTTPNERPLGTGLLISCETAATIISEMRGDGDRSRIKASLGCIGDKDCSVKNTRVLELMDE